MAGEGMTDAVGTTSDGNAARAAGDGSTARADWPKSVPTDRGRRGLRVRRVWTTDGVHPYDEVAWERRDVVMTNWRDGSVNFEQRGVEFPDFWSVNAANIVTTKYFRGALSRPEREHSLKQLVDRVVGVYVAAGREHGYFASAKDAEIFEHELAYALIHQVFSFNSPVWFNVGTSSPQQVSACQPYNALVSTTAGLIPIGKLVEDDAVGTKVHDAHGTTRIVATKANGVKEVLRLHTKAGDTLDVTPDHLVWRANDLVIGEFTVAEFLRPGDSLLHVDPDVGGSDRRLAEISRVERLGEMEVYDIQTESGEYLAGNVRVHNCFILAVDDTMDSILEWYREEGLIFKGGSGAGVNLSRIRSSKELLSSGGTASGPVSFMRGADASAGTIKSGGATRRAAKMVILDVDHPDIGEFITTKAREEDKIRALRDAGFDMDLGGHDIVSVQYQNANNSVRVSDEFMKAVEEGEPFELRARLDGSVVETVEARALFRSMAQAAWECADPGIQYDDTINDWHTNPETGRITASNPCFTGDTLVHTDQGLVRFDELVDRVRQGERFGVYTHDATNPDAPANHVELTTPDAIMITGVNEIMRVELSNGMVLRCTPNHRIWTTNRGYVEAKDLTDADSVLPSNLPTPAVAASREFRLLPGTPVAAGDVIPTDAHRATRLPEKWGEEFAHLLGWLTGDGCVRRGVRGTPGSTDAAVMVYSQEDQVAFLPRHQRVLSEIVGFTPKPSLQPNGTIQLRSNRTAFVEFLCGLGVTTGRAVEKRLPAAVLQAPPEIQAAFLKGLFDADGCAAELANGTKYVGIGSVSVELLRDVQRLLSCFGVGSRIYTTRQQGDAMFEYTTVGGESRTYVGGQLYDLRISGENVQGFASMIGFDHPRKARRLAGWLPT